MSIIPIDSLADPRLTDFAHRTDVALKHDQKTEHGLYIAESALVLERALRAGHQPRAVLSLGGTTDEAQRLLALHPETPVFTGPGELLAELTGYELHRGLIASLDRPPLPDPADLLRDSSLVVIIENVVDPTNVGAIFRSVGAIGADAVFVTERCSDPFYRRAIRVSMGTVLQVPWTRVPGWAETRELLHANDFEIAALALTDDAVSLRDYAATIAGSGKRVALVLGTEGAGLTPEAIEAADVVVQIPMKHGIDSLNVAAASAVAIWALGEA
ncbi:TrmH family RNA methyltransferase [Lysinibacter cavernae]|uniref:tRNA G18 (Ribose-2'-O)-methylase SpoU n=1 Tax=Lysinibacter cavernae TaxID=1640652 RepID=A0A7X5R1E1_9MICO|nr:RNA methyltransferase [Lysinibacter cavernae]NIH53924.1 tRNA G18 (ribose-2'-O)-methylase SpoU [Lysinibacter cavernae]